MLKAVPKHTGIEVKFFDFQEDIQVIIYDGLALTDRDILTIEHL